MVTAVILRVLSIVVLMAMATASVDFSETALQNQYKIEPRKISVQLINPDVEVKFSRHTVPQVNSVLLNAISTSKKGEQNACGKSLGIALRNKEFCGISLIGLEVDKLRSGTEIRFALVFGSGDDLFLLDVPVFSIPSELAGKQKELEAWAGSKNVGIDGPVDMQKLKGISEGNDVTLKFEWLEQILTRGIFSNQVERIIGDLPPVGDAFVSRPVLLQEELIDELIKVVNFSQPSDDDE